MFVVIVVFVAQRVTHPHDLLVKLGFDALLFTLSSLDAAVADVCVLSTSCFLFQENGSDCGAFAVSFASYLSDNLPFDFRQADTTQMRRRMLWSILHQRLV